MAESHTQHARPTLALSVGPARLAPGLHIVSTPIGNLSDVTVRALATLAAVDVILAEDTRVTKRLLARYAIKARLEAYHEHNAEEARPRILARLAAGATLALVSDAGTPLLSDPGFKLVAAALDQGSAVVAVPGPSALLAALVIAGLPTDRFFFEGFLPQRAAQRRARLRELAGMPGTLVAYESPRRLADMLADAAAMLGDRPAAVARELTKLHETLRRGSLAELARLFAGEGPPRGEIVVLIGPGRPAEPAAEAADLDARLAEALGRLSLKEAVAEIAAATGLKRRDVYARALLVGRRS